MAMRWKLLFVGMITLALTVSNQAVYAQRPIPDSTRLFPSVVLEGDTIPHISIPEVVKYGRRRFKNRYQMYRYYKLIRNLKKTYPYAQIAKQKLLEMNTHLKTLKTEREKKLYIKQSEQELRAQFEKDLTKMTISQGRMLIKLIDRETGSTSYELVKELKGGFSAAFWQGIARIFGSSLKTRFDPEGDDKVLNELIILYEQGLI